MPSGDAMGDDGSCYNYQTTTFHGTATFSSRRLLSPAFTTHPPFCLPRRGVTAAPRVEGRCGLLENAWALLRAQLAKAGPHVR